MIFRDVHFKQFEQEIQDKKIICIGCGKIFYDMLKLWDKSIIKKIVLIADNYKQNTDVNINGKMQKIVSVESLIDYDLNDICILITSMYCRSIYNQLKELLSNTDVNCYIYPIISLRTDDYNWRPRNSTPQIPKIIHYFWFGGKEIPEKNKRCIESWIKYCPDYEIKKWTENNYDLEKCNYMKQAYESRKWGFVPDFARLDVLYEYGGIYLDTDVELVRNLDNLLYENAFLGFQRDFWINLGLGCGSREKVELFKEMRDAYHDISFVKNGNLNLVASPYYQTMTLCKHGLKCNNIMQRVGDISIFPTDVFDPQGYSYGKIILTPNTYGIHHYNESWVDKEQRNENLIKYAEVDYFR